MPIAIYHFHVKMVSRGKGKSAVGKAAYISGEKIKNEYDGMVHDYRKKKEIVHKEILLPENVPQKFKKRSVLWNAVEKSETRKNSQTARDIDAALPVELTRNEQIDLVRNFCNQCFVSSGMCVDFAIHDKRRAAAGSSDLPYDTDCTLIPDNKDCDNFQHADSNPHVHILLTTRHVDENGFTTKDRSWNDRELLKLWRKRWADWCNHKLYFVNGEKIDHRSYAEQGIEKVPQLHLGTAACAIEKKGFKTDKGSRNRKIQLANTDAEIERLKFQISSLQNDRKRLVKEMLETVVGCPVSEMCTFIAVTEIMEKIEAELLKQNIQHKIASASENKMKIFVNKQYQNEINKLWGQIVKENQAVKAPHSEPDKPKKKPRSR